MTHSADREGDRTMVPGAVDALVEDAAPLVAAVALGGVMRDADPRIADPTAAATLTLGHPALRFLQHYYENRN